MGPAALPMSPMATQYAPDAVSVPVSCGVVVLAMAWVVPPDRKMQLPFASGLPMPRPMVIVAGGPAAVMVTLTVPGVVTVNVCTLLVPGVTVPLNVTVVTVADGETTFDVLLDP